MANVSDYTCNKTYHHDVVEHFYVYGLTVGIICVLGLVGNTLCFIVLQIDKKQCSATLLLKALAVSDSVFLIHVFLIRTVLNIMQFTEGCDHSKSVKFDNVTFYLWPFSHIARINCIWMTVLIAINRYIAVCKPLKAAILCTIKITKVQIVVVLICACLYTIPTFLKSHVYGDLYEQFSNNYIYNLLYESISYMFLVVLGPFLVLLVLNSLILKELWTARKRRMQFRQQPTSDDKNERNLTVVISMVVVVFCVCNTPACVLRFVMLFVDHEEFHNCPANWCMWFDHTSQVLVYLNSAVNFIIYFVFRKQFRKYLASLCRQE